MTSEKPQATGSRIQVTLPILTSDSTRWSVTSLLTSWPGTSLCADAPSISVASHLDPSTYFSSVAGARWRRSIVQRIESLSLVTLTAPNWHGRSWVSGLTVLGSFAISYSLWYS